MSKVLVDTDTFLVIVDIVQGKALLHVSVKEKLTHSKVRVGRKLFEKVKAEVVEMGYDKLFTATQSVHFLDLMGVGYTYVSHFFDENGVYGEFVLWELK